MKVHASILPYIHGYECLFYAFACVFLSYDLVSTYVMFIRFNLKETRFGTYVFQTLKIQSIYIHLFIIKPEVVGMTVMTQFVV